MKQENNCHDHEHFGIGSMYLAVGNILRLGGNDDAARSIYKQGLEQNMPVEPPNAPLPNWVNQIICHLAEIANK